MAEKRTRGRPRELASKKPKTKQVVRLRHNGLSFGAIGKKMGFSKQYAMQLYERFVEEQAAQ